MKDYEKNRNIAKQVNLINFLKDRYNYLITYNTTHRRYEHPIHDSIEIKSTHWNWWSRDEHHDNIDYLTTFCDKSYTDAVKELCEYAGVYGVNVPAYKRISNSQIPDIAPHNTNTVYKYLIDKRHLDKKIIEDLVRTGEVFADDRNNIVFVNSEYDMCYYRGTYEKNGEPNKYKGVSGPHPDGFIEFYPKNEEGTYDNIETVYITESPIDSISLYMLLKPELKRNAIFCAVCGLKHTAMEMLRFRYKECSLVIAVDCDDAGDRFYKKYSFLDRMVIPPQYRDTCKDWNALLCERIKENKL